MQLRRARLSNSILEICLKRTLRCSFVIRSWHDGISAEDLYEIARAWWVMSPAHAQCVARVLAVAGGVVREVYQPTQWLRLRVSQTLCATCLSTHYRGCSDRTESSPQDPISDSVKGQLPGGAIEPGLRERVLPLINAFENDPLWAQSRVA